MLHLRLSGNHTVTEARFYYAFMYSKDSTQGPTVNNWMIGVCVPHLDKATNQKGRHNEKLGTGH